MIADLRKREILPSFRQLPHEHYLDHEFYETDDGVMYNPSRHWCLLAEIEEVEFFFRLRLIVRDVDNHKFPMAFYLEDQEDSRGGSLDLIKFKKGNTIAVMYAHQHPFMDLTIGIRQRCSKTFKVLPVSMEAIVRLNKQVHENFAKYGDRKCHACDRQLERSKKCGACGLVSYCSKECQTQEWKNTHKDDCKKLKHLKGFFGFDWYQFNDFEAVPT